MAGRGWCGGCWRRGSRRWLTFPAVVSIVFLVTPFTVYFSPIYEDTLRSRGAAWVLSFALTALGFFYYWTRLRLDPVPKEYPHLVSVWITFAEAIADGALGLTLMLGHHLVAGDWYTALNKPWGPTPKQDQVWGGGALWLIGDLAGVPFLGALWRRMFDEDRDKAAEVDAELDADRGGGGDRLRVGVRRPAGARGLRGLRGLPRGPVMTEDVDESTPVSISHTSPGGADGPPPAKRRSAPVPGGRAIRCSDAGMGFLEDE